MLKEIADLIAELETAEGPSASADQIIARTLGSLVGNYTSSVDSCFELAEEFLPGWYIDHAGDNATGTAGNLRVFGHTVEYANEVQRVQGDAPTKPLAYALAILKAILIDRESYRDSVISSISGDERVSDAIIEQVSAVVGMIAAAVRPPEIEIDEDDHHIVLRWLAGSGGSFSLTFVGKGEVCGYLIHPDSKAGAWRSAIDDAVKLGERLNCGMVRDVMSKRLGSDR